MYEDIDFAEVESPDPSLSDEQLLRAVEIERWRVTMWDAHAVDHYGKSGVALEIRENGRQVYWTGLGKAGATDGLVYIGHGMAIDSDRALWSAVGLCCYDATHDEQERPREPGWGAEGLSEMASLCEEG